MSGVCSASNTSKHDCVSFAEANKHVGTTQCVSGTVLHVEDGSNGVTFLNFCKDAKACPFTVIVFPGDLRKVGDVRQLEGRTVEIKGTIEEYDGRAEIILRHPKQMGEGLSSWFLRCPRTMTSSAMATTVPASSAITKPARRSTKSRARRFRSKIQKSRSSGSPLFTIHGFHTIPLRNSSSGYFVPRHVMPSFERVWTMERTSVYMNRLVLTGCRKK